MTSAQSKKSKTSFLKKGKKRKMLFWLLLVDKCLLRGIFCLSITMHMLSVDRNQKCSHSDEPTDCNLIKSFSSYGVLAIYLKSYGSRLRFASFETGMSGIGILSHENKETIKILASKEFKYIVKWDETRIQTTVN